jgi:hypothetical protein
MNIQIINSNSKLLQNPTKSIEMISNARRDPLQTTLQIQLNETKIIFIYYSARKLP